MLSENENTKWSACSTRGLIWLNFFLDIFVDFFNFFFSEIWSIRYIVCIWKSGCILVETVPSYINSTSAKTCSHIIGIPKSTVRITGAVVHPFISFPVASCKRNVLDTLMELILAGANFGEQQKSWKSLNLAGTYFGEWWIFLILVGTNFGEWQPKSSVLFCLFLSNFDEF